MGEAKKFGLGPPGALALHLWGQNGNRFSTSYMPYIQLCKVCVLRLIVIEVGGRGAKKHLEKVKEKKTIGHKENIYALICRHRLY